MATGNTPARHPTTKELNHDIRRLKIDRTAEIVRYLIKYGSYALSTYFLSVSARSFAGETTLANFAVNLVGTMNVNEWGGWLIAGLCGAGWIRQRRVHHNYIQQYAPATKAKEMALHPGRSSSGLSERGDTHPGDKR
jgi:hypothetical protein